MKKIGLFLLFPLIIFSQNLDLNEDFYQNYLRFENYQKV